MAGAKGCGYLYRHGYNYRSLDDCVEQPRRSQAWKTALQTPVKLAQLDCERIPGGYYSNITNEMMESIGVQGTRFASLIRVP